MITVRASIHDKYKKMVQRYENLDSGYTPSGAPSHYAVRDTHPDEKKLTPLALWLYLNCPQYVGGSMPHPQQKYRVVCYNGKTIAEQQGWTDAHRTVWAPNGDMPAKIDDYAFPRIEPGETDEQYWNSMARKIISIGIIKIVCGNSVWEVR